MGLTVTTTTQTSAGSTRELYLHITEFYQNKEGVVQLPVRYYKKKGGDVVEVLAPPFEKVFKYELEGQEKIDGLNKIQCYAKVKQTLLDANKVVLDDI